MVSYLRNFRAWVSALIDFSPVVLALRRTWGIAICSTPPMAEWCHGTDPRADQPLYVAWPGQGIIWLAVVYGCCVACGWNFSRWYARVQRGDPTGAAQPPTACRFAQTCREAGRQGGREGGREAGRESGREGGKWTHGTFSLPSHHLRCRHHDSKLR